VVYFPGSTIGNFRPEEAHAMLLQIAALCGKGGGLLLGVDLQKDISTIEAAYNDSRGVTAEFNRNLLHRINDELDGDFDPDRFRHHASYNQELGRVELYLVSQCQQAVTIDGESFEFDADDAICTEYSHKYTIDGVARMAADAGFDLERCWTDDRDYFAVVYLAVLV
jgi:dimethylhistidine N-methyltransferase